MLTTVFCSGLIGTMSAFSCPYLGHYFSDRVGEEICVILLTLDREVIIMGITYNVITKWCECDLYTTLESSFGFA